MCSELLAMFAYFTTGILTTDAAIPKDSRNTTI
ncbi:hypothetical protein YS65_003268 [Salmonella enterica subsp. enterica]|uniref:Uncharacterized protein n=1 Tax=Salmonella newport TaxID=108619 RepID=A0A5X8Y0L0_SALNE|nr:hypothetical protein [Salmonella enterica]EBS2908566.1 hypothetical protein [Salmonella enterica subsp. enterica serovar Flottbek]EBS4086115.1 hypothetical protein [Salmonella enterica subsp. enterica serovar Newport]ECC9721168.1 hypothetical protein [Salmonella enterica subsp. diarizonae]EDP8833892.1 hypothetical protein [Salmonella enterica subsp. enterica]EEE4104358.1 hypothetical protein [Salmonella enterica subsp. enterica serovar Enteritidis]